MEPAIKIITAPDMIFDQSDTILMVQPGNELKKELEAYVADKSTPINIYFFSDKDTDIKWLLTVAKFANVVIIDIDNTTESISHFMSYLLSCPNTYYKTQHMKAPWGLLNQNRFYDFPNFESETE